MRPRIFTLMLLAFALVIVLGVGGVTSFFWLAVVSFERGRESWGPPPEYYAWSEARRLAAYYERSGSWAGVEPNFADIERHLQDVELQGIALVDASGRLVRGQGNVSIPPRAPAAPSAPRLPDGGESGPFWPAEALPGRGDEATTAGVEAPITVQSVPIRNGREVVGTLVFAYDGSPRAMAGSFRLSDIGRGFLSAALALAAILLGLAAIFSGRISRPLRQLNGAAQAMAAGDLQVRVRPPMVREVADLAQSFNRMADALALADQQRRQLTADVAHELRTPLSVVKGRLEGIQDGIYRADPEQIDGLLDEVALLERLIEDLRLLALADAGQLALYPEAVDAAHLVCDAQRSFAQQAEERGVRLLVEAPAALPELTADPQRIAQVLGNLVGNALRHTPAGGEVRVAARQIDSGAGQAAILFEVRDTGAGIAAADLPHIFDRFYRADRSRARSSGGAGLGLAIARRIVEAHGGRIWATSEPGAGACICFALPV
jgi:signal transduction histidine kinase